LLRIEILLASTIGLLPLSLRHLFPNHREFPTLSVAQLPLLLAVDIELRLPLNLLLSSNVSPLLRLLTLGVHLLLLLSLRISPRFDLLLTLDLHLLLLSLDTHLLLLCVSPLISLLALNVHLLLLLTLCVTPLIRLLTLNLHLLLTLLLNLLALHLHLLALLLPAAAHLALLLRSLLRTLLTLTAATGVSTAAIATTTLLLCRWSSTAITAATALSLALGETRRG
jgi:hypothetical protein